MDCVFCKIVDGEIPSNKLYEDEEVLAFYDLDPQAPIHFLVIPKKHLGSALELTGEDSAVAGKVFSIIAEIAERLDLSDGLRVVTNVGYDGGQSVDHLHFHVLAGRQLSWPPG